MFSEMHMCFMEHIRIIPDNRYDYKTILYFCGLLCKRYGKPHRSLLTR